MIKYGVIQPLTGGIICGAIEAIGHTPDWIISYPGLAKVKYNKDNSIKSTGNEYNILKWLKDNYTLPPYQLFNKHPFQNTSLDINLINEDMWTTSAVDYSNTDLVVSVPVCSGLSQATIASNDTKDTRNINMLWNTEYTLARIKPKIYIFENAPLLFSNSGRHIRDTLNNLGMKYGYSVVYYRTNTLLHDNCQNRLRTFVLFIKYRDSDTGTPDFNFENKPVGVIEYLSRIPKDASQQVTIKMPLIDELCFDYIKHKFGSNFRDYSGKPWFIRRIIEDNLFDDICNYALKSNYDEKTINSLVCFIHHVQEKISNKKNFYGRLPGYTSADKPIPAVIFKNIPSLLHYSEDRLFTIREYLHLMGMPSNFEIAGDINIDYPEIGQNVPARTAQWIISEAVRIINSWDTIERNNSPILFVDNIKQKTFSN